MPTEHFEYPQNMEAQEMIYIGIPAVMMRISAQRTRGDCRWDTNGDAEGVTFMGDRLCLIGDLQTGSETV